MRRKQAPEKALTEAATSATPSIDTSGIPHIPATEWQERHFKITDFFFTFLRDNKRRPSYREIAKATGYDVAAVHRHIKKISTEDARVIYKAAVDQVLLKTVHAALTGDAADRKLFYQVVMGWSEKATLRHEHSFDFRKMAEQGKLIDDPKERQRHLFQLLGAHNRVDQAGEESRFGKPEISGDDISEGA